MGRGGSLFPVFSSYMLRMNLRHLSELSATFLAVIGLIMLFLFSNFQFPIRDDLPIWSYKSSSNLTCINILIFSIVLKSAYLFPYFPVSLLESRSYFL